MPAIRSALDGRLGLLQPLLREVKRLLEPFGLSLDPRVRVNTLGPAYQQVVEIAKALSLRSDILVMDEPTAALTGREVNRLFEVIRSLRRSGVSVIYISHRLQEIKQVADRVTVLRDGRRIVTAPVEGITVDEIVRHMVGRALTEQYPKDRVEAGKEVLMAHAAHPVGGKPGTPGDSVTVQGPAGGTPPPGPQAHPKTVLEAAEITRALTRIAHEIIERTRGAEQVVLLGIPTRGVPLAERMAARITQVEGRPVPHGSPGGQD